MYNNFNHNCYCRSRYNRFGEHNVNLRYIQEGADNIKEGIRDIYRGFEDIRQKDGYVGEQEILKGIRVIEIGVKDVFKSLVFLEFNGDCRAKIIREGLNDIREGERKLLEGLENIRIRNNRDGIREIREGIKDIEVGLKNIQEGLYDIIRLNNL